MNDNNGIVRRLDDMGRLVLPKDLRRLMHWNNGDPIQIVPRSEDALLLRRYNQMLSIQEAAAVFARAFYAEYRIPVAISDENVVLVQWGMRIPAFAVLAPDLRAGIRERKEYDFRTAGTEQALCKDYPDTVSYVIPVLNRDTAVGCLALARNLHGGNPGELQRVLRFAAKLMEVQMKI